jgi:hypothetical protein
MGTISDGISQNKKCYIDEIQPTMMKTVTWLQEVGYHTIDSGDGVLNVEAGMEDALDYPHVMMTVDPTKMVEEANRLYYGLLNNGIEGGQVEVSYNPEDGLAILMLIGITDASLPQVVPEIKIKPYPEIAGQELRFVKDDFSHPHARLNSVEIRGKGYKTGEEK